MRLAIALLPLLCGCKRAEPTFPSEEDCAALRADPGNAFQRFGGRSPAEFWSIVEACWAPGGDDCQRAWVGRRAVPGMARPTEAQWARYEAQFLAACRSLPPAQQRCLVISHAIGHAAECEASGAKAALDRLLRDAR